MDIVLASKDHDLRLSLELLLREEPGVYVVGTASHSGPILALIQTTCPDLVLFDWDLPGQPSTEVLAEIISAECRPQVIVLGKDPETREAALAAGADGFVVKGDPPKQLLDALRQVGSQS